MKSVNRFELDLEAAGLVALVKRLDRMGTIEEKALTKELKRYTKKNKGYYSKNDLIKAFSHHHRRLSLKTSPTEFGQKLKKKPIRTQSGVAPVSILTKPFPCPGKCIFCPSDVRMPKSYLADEPGAQRAARNAFDPYLQTYNRLRAFATNGHPTDKAELIILGGTWSYYPLPYQIWFIKRAFEALSDFGDGVDRRDEVKRASDFTDVIDDLDGNEIKETYNQRVSRKLVDDIGGRLLNSWEDADWEELAAAQKVNQMGKCRNVGLVIETRPDNISEEEVKRIRRLGCTKAQIGFQSLNDKVLGLNKRGHDVAATREAMRLLRRAGLKIQAHWMPNLYGSSVKGDIADYKKIFEDKDFRPDELKIYPCSLIKSAELMAYYKRGEWRPYSRDELLAVLTECIQATPEYCRLTRVIRDIPSGDIVVGNKLTNFRQIAEGELDRVKAVRGDIRSREIKGDEFEPAKLRLKVSWYKTAVGRERFLQFVTPENKIVAFLRLSLPNKKSFIDELGRSAIIREVHVYGVAANLSERSRGKAQHLGLGTKLIERAKKIAAREGYKDLAVISAVGTREYYERLGFEMGELYQHFKLG